MSLQTLDRAVIALRALGASSAEGLRLIDLQAQLKLSKTTAHRLLSALVKNGLAMQDEVTRRYRLGSGLAALAWTVQQSTPDLKRIAQPSVLRLAEETGDTVFLSARDGLESVCIGRASGAFPIQANTVGVGTRRPLGIGAGGIAMLAALPEDDAERLLVAVAPKIKPYTRTSIELVRRSVKAARTQGYSFSDGQIMQGVRGVAVALCDGASQPIGSLGIAAIRDRLNTPRLREVVAILQAERRRLERALHS